MYNMCHTLRLPLLKNFATCPQFQECVSGMAWSFTDERHQWKAELQGHQEKLR